MSDSTQAAKERLITDLKLVMSDIDALVDSGSKDASAEMRDMQSKLREKIKLAQDKLLDAEHALTRKVKEVAKSTDDYVHENPWQSIGIAAGVGVLVGLLIGRR